MKAFFAIFGSFFAVAAVAVVAVILFCLSVVNQEVDLRVAVEAKQEANKASFDTVWKILQNKAGVVSQYKDDFKDIWPALIEGRYKSGGGLMKWVQERNPNFDSSLYKDLMASVEAERKEFLRDQKQLIDLNREHNQLCKRPVSGFILRTFGDATPIEITVVTSSRTEESFESGQDNDVDLFKKTPPAADK